MCMQFHETKCILVCVNQYEIEAVYAQRSPNEHVLRLIAFWGLTREDCLPRKLHLALLEELTSLKT